MKLFPKTMTPFPWRCVCFIVLLLGFVTISGCTTQHQNLFAKPTYIPTSVPAPSSDPWHRINIDHIPDYKTDTSFNIIGSSILMVNGTTDYPAGTKLNLSIIRGNDPNEIIKAPLEVINNKTGNSGLNSFSYGYNMKGNPPGYYTVVISDPTHLNLKSTQFNITSDLPYNKWIHINPLGEIRPGNNIPISGTTDLPPGSRIAIDTYIIAQSCPPPPRTPDSWLGPRTFCGGSCFGAGSTHQTAQVVRGDGGINMWNSSFSTSGYWCPNEEYRIIAEAINWTNATFDTKLFRFSS